MPEFIAACLICDSMPNATSSIKEAVEIVARQNPFGFTGTDIVAFYEHKMKVLLLDSALGMTPDKEWKGRYEPIVLVESRFLINRFRSAY